jgi:Tol biopolymer transport system component/DNA-binding winged helix-turn-helix (wHTH) protein
MRYEFGPFRLDTETLVLFRGGEPINITPKALQTLRVLVENCGRVVSKKELLTCVWADVRVDEANLTQNIFALRRILGEKPRDHRFIATMPGEGYRFVAEVRSCDEAAEAPPERLLSNVPQGTNTSQSLTNWTSFVLLALALGVATGVLTLVRKQDAPTNYSAVPLTSNAGSALCPSFSPEGERVAFSWDGDKQDNFDIYVKQIGLGLPLRLTTDYRPELSPAWSPDGRTIAFLRLSSHKKADLLLIPSATIGAERRIAETTVPNELLWRVRFLSWSPDGKWLLVSDGSLANVGATVGLSLVSVETGEKRRLTQPPAWNDDVSPAMSPDMKHLVFARHTGVVSDLYDLNLSQRLQPVGEPKPLTVYHEQASSPAWMQNGQSLLFTRYSTRGSPSLWRMTFPPSSRPEPVPIAADNARWLALSRKGDALAFTRETTNANLWALESAGPPLCISRNKSSKPWITSSREESTPQFSPNGEHIAFQSTRSGWSEIWIADRDGSHLRQLTNLKAAVAGFPHWSPDGTKIVFHSRGQSQSTLFVQDVQGGGPRSLTRGVGNDYSPAWSHDGKWIYFSSERNGGDQIWRMPAEGGSATQMTAHGGWAPAESADGRYLFYTKSKENDIWRIPVAGGEEHLMVSNVAALGTAYAIGKQGIYFIALPKAPTRQHLAFLNVATRQVKSLADVLGQINLGLTISPDEQILLYSQLDHVNSDVMLVEHFR